MPKSLVIVESPNKIKKIQGYLGPDYIVKASFGHCYQIDPSGMSIDIEDDFNPKYTIAARKSNVVQEIKEAARVCDTCYIASDPDREGEAIGWHIANFVIKKSCKIKRVVFHEITKSAVQAAFKNASDLNEPLYHAQQARSVLDRLVGFGVSPVLWKKVCKGTSAGRVQSIGLELIVDRQKEIDAFIPEEYWDIEGIFRTPASEEFKASYLKENKITCEKEAQDLLSAIKAESNWAIQSLDSGSKKRSPFPPFNTSTLQQFAAITFGWPGKKTMSVAQSLFEAGLHTYHRTDSFSISSDFLKEVRDYISFNYDKKYLPAKALFYKTKSANAQEAHECIRPTDLKSTPSSCSSKLNADQIKLYSAIYKRFISCQMADAEFDSKKAVIVGDSKKLKFSANGQTLRFDGFLKEWTYSSAKEETLPDIKEKDSLGLSKIIPAQHFTKPPAFFNDASIIKALDENGVGRPSTYAGIIDILIARGYIIREGKAFRPTDLGILICDYLKGSFKNLMDIGYTSRIEEKLDQIAEGKHVWHSVVREFYTELDKDIKTALKGSSMKQAEETEILCPECGKYNLIIRNSRFGKFYGCAGYTERGKNKCSATFKIGEDGSPVKKVTNYLKDLYGNIRLCDKCGSKIVIRKSKKAGKDFGGCTSYPKCRQVFSLDGEPIEFKKKRKKEEDERG